ncbi:hypothetical protein SAMN05421659_11399 [[Clostridium] fimetarium]|uniref:Uncharacterized protein n=1 Tax=[Clostridium] fimetarium TaxID=99656 RepID=A0A1I0RAW8_9FIRM|nr:hypothetical protein SAMN05421659_11399 [[Clostridium] fimetarium]
MTRYIVKNIFLTNSEVERMNKIKMIIIEQINRNNY